MEASRRWLRAGLVGSPHGLDGTFHVLEPRPQLLLLGAEVMVGGRSLQITRRSGTDTRPLVRVEGYEDRAAADALRGEELLVDRSQAPPLEQDEWWAEDLEGCAVLCGDSVVGNVRRLVALPSCEVLEVERPNDIPDLLVPLIADAVRRVDIERSEIEIDLRFLGEED